MFPVTRCTLSTNPAIRVPPTPRRETEEGKVSDSNKHQRWHLISESKQLKITALKTLNLEFEVINFRCYYFLVRSHIITHLKLAVAVRNELLMGVRCTGESHTVPHCPHDLGTHLHTSTREDLAGSYTL